MARGDHVYVWREPSLERKRAPYQHHGIDCGDGTVIHFAHGEGPKHNAVVRRTSMTEFLAGGGLLVKVYPPKHTSLSGDEVVRRAESCLGKRKYNLYRNNCEHFATWCKTGTSGSSQVKKVLAALVSVIGATASGAAIALGRSGRGSSGGEKKGARKGTTKRGRHTRPTKGRPGPKTKNVKKRG